MVNAIILAGTQPIKDLDDAGNKALYKINGKMMIEYVTDAVKNAQDIGKIIIVGPENELRESLDGKVDAIIDSAGSIMQNLLAGAKCAGFEDYVLVCTSDIPMITGEAINDFITRSRDLKVDFCYPIIEKKTSRIKFPEVERTYIKMKEGSFTGGNIFYINPKVIEKGLAVADKLVSARKNPLKMARVFSIRFVIRLLMGRLTIAMVEKKFSEILKIKAKAVITEYPEIGNDVDKSSHIDMAIAHLRNLRIY